MRIALLAAAFASLVSGCAVTDFARYALPRSGVGDLGVGESAPDPPLVTLDGQPTQLSDHLRDRPLVLVFGSFT